MRRGAYRVLRAARQVRAAAERAHRYAESGGAPATAASQVPAAGQVTREAARPQRQPDADGHAQADRLNRQAEPLADEQRDRQAASAADPDAGHDTRAEPLQQAVEAAAAIAETGGLGTPGRPVNRRSPFFVGMMAAAGVAVTYGLAELIIRARSVLVLIGLALFIAAGLDPAVSELTRRRLPRWSAVLIVLLVVTGVIAAFIAAAIPPLTAQATTLTNNLPHYLHTIQNHNSELRAG